MKKLSVFAMLLMLLAILAHAQQENHLIVNMPFSNDMMFQPVDIYVEFEQPCTAIDEKTHSISILYKNKEIDSQIYNLQFGADGMLNSCNLVFLYQGRGDYVISYGTDVRTVSYQDYVNVTDSFYSIEPLPGYSAKLNYYGVEEDGKILFGICQEGHILHLDMGNKIIKVQDDAATFEMQNWAQTFSFALFHSDGTETGSDEHLVGKNILVDGNLMTRVAIETSSKDGFLRTRAIYTYYHSPLPEKRLFINLQHEISSGWSGNATYAYIMFIKARSKTIDEFNMGDIYPFTHFNGENGVEEYSIETNPDTKDFRWIISSADNVILGNPPWVSVDNKQRTYTFIFSQPHLTVSAGVKQEISVPGLEIDGGGISLGERGSFNEGILFDGAIELYIGNYEDIQQETSSFFQFQNYRTAATTGNFSVLPPQYNLTIKTYGRSAVPFSAYVSALLGIPLPTLEAEIWDNSLVAKNTINFKRTSFTLPEGSYIVKIFRNGYRGRTFIGGYPVILEKDTFLRIGCTFQTYLFVEAPEGSAIKLLKNQIEIAQYRCNGTEIRIPIPAFSTYTLQVLYNGFLMAEEQILAVLPIHRTYSFETYGFQLSLKDTLGLPLAITPTISIESDDMYEPMLIYPSGVGTNYIFNSLSSGTYQLVVRYKSFILKHEIVIPDDKNLELVFPAVYTISVKTYDKRGFLLEANSSFERENERFLTSILPPADYIIKVCAGEQTIATRKISLTTNSSYDIVTTKAIWYPYLIPIALILLFIWRQKIPIFCAFLLSLSFLFSWWTLSGDTITSLYLIPPGMVEMGETYGTILNLPSLMQTMLSIILALLVSAIGMMSIKYLVKFSFIPLVIALATFVTTLYLFSNITVGGLFGSSLVDGVHSKWGPGLGFYLAMLSLILLTLYIFVPLIKTKKVV